MFSIAIVCVYCFFSSAYAVESPAQSSPKLRAEQNPSGRQEDHRLYVLFEGEKYLITRDDRIKRYRGSLKNPRVNDYCLLMRLGSAIDCGDEATIKFLGAVKNSLQTRLNSKKKLGAAKKQEIDDFIEWALPYCPSPIRKRKLRHGEDEYLIDPTKGCILFPKTFASRNSLVTNYRLLIDLARHIKFENHEAIEMFHAIVRTLLYLIPTQTDDAIGVIQSFISENQEHMHLMFMPNENEALRDYAHRVALVNYYHAQHDGFKIAPPVASLEYFDSFIPSVEQNVGVCYLGTGVDTRSVKQAPESLPIVAKNQIDFLLVTGIAIASAAVLDAALRKERSWLVRGVVKGKVLATKLWGWLTGHKTSTQETNSTSSLV